MPNGVADRPGTHRALITGKFWPRVVRIRSGPAVRFARAGTGPGHPGAQRRRSPRAPLQCGGTSG
ncbi:hypothetical protein ACWEQU_26250 [Streptomyces nodosus]